MMMTPESWALTILFIALVAIVVLISTDDNDPAAP